MRKLIKEYVENINEEETTPINGDDENLSGLYRRVQKRLLDNDLYNHAAVMRRLGWEGDENTNRSLFEKKLKREKNDSGGEYTFEEADLEKIITILDTESKPKDREQR